MEIDGGGMDLGKEELQQKLLKHNELKQKMGDVNKLCAVATHVGAMADGTDVGATSAGKKANTDTVCSQRLSGQEPQEQIDFGPGLHVELVQQAFVGSPVTQQTSMYDNGKSGAELCRCSVKMYERCNCSSNMDTKCGDMAVGKEGNVDASGKEGNTDAAMEEGDTAAGNFSSNMDTKCGDMAVGKEGNTDAVMEEGDMSAGKEGDMAAGEENNDGKEVNMTAGGKVKPKDMLKRMVWRENNRNMDLLQPNLSWDEMVVEVLHMIRCREFTRKDEKLGYEIATRFCYFNLAFFDLDKESTVVPRKRMKDVEVFDSSDLCIFEDSVNVISVSFAESDVNYPINIYGTILARDQYDYRCIYLFKRERDNPQLIESEDDILTLTGPFRALAVTDSMFFEFHLKIKCDGEVDKDFSRGFLEHNVSRHSCQPMILPLRSCLSEVVMVYSPVPFAMEASLKLYISNGPSNFTGTITAYTTENVENEIILYDSEAPGTQTKLGADGSVPLTRCIVAVPVDEGLVFNVSVGEDESEAECELILSPDVEQYSGTLGSHELQVKVIWSAILRERRPKMWEHIGHTDVLW